jgi:hypothetical protein
VQLAVRVQIVDGREFATAAFVGTLLKILLVEKSDPDVYCHQKVLFLQMSSLVSLKPKMGVERPKTALKITLWSKTVRNLIVLVKIKGSTLNGLRP